MSNHLYVMRCRTDGEYKVGVANEPQSRLRTVSKTHPAHDIELVLVEPLFDGNGKGYANKVEAPLHRHFRERQSRLHQGSQEWFRLGDDDLMLVRAVCSYVRERVAARGDARRAAREMESVLMRSRRVPHEPRIELEVVV